MKIAHSELGLTAQHQRHQAQQAQERLRAGPDPGAGVALRLSDAVRRTPPSMNTGSRGEIDTLASDPVSGWPPGMQVLARMIEALTGVAVRVFRPDALRGEGPTTQALSGAPQPRQAPVGQTPSNPELPGEASWTYTRTEVRYEHEVTLFAAQGSVQTADGRTLDFSLGLRMEREFLDMRQTRLSVGGETAKDPLVLHFGHAAPSLSGPRIEFDLNADGHTETLPFVGAGSGFLVWDRNGNGQADSGQELFGPQSGDGFTELAMHDQDHNGWIDEADTIFQELRIWRQNSQGQQSLQTLTEAGVGALSLSRVATPFSLRDADQSRLGEVRSSGLYLHDNGQAGVMQQIDLMV